MSLDPILFVHYCEMNYLREHHLLLKHELTSNYFPKNMSSLGKSYDSQNRFWKVDIYYEISHLKKKGQIK